MAVLPCYPTCSVPLWGLLVSRLPSGCPPTAPASTRAHRTRCPPQDRVLLPASSGMQPARDVLASTRRGPHRTGDELHPRHARRNTASPAQPGSQLVGPPPSSLTGLSSYRTNTVAQWWYGLPPQGAGLSPSSAPPTGRPPASQPQAVSCHPAAPLIGDPRWCPLLSVEDGSCSHRQSLP